MKGKKMFSVAIVGPDGAGKTTLTRRLQGSSQLPFKYLYMGISLQSSNVSLPTTRLVERWKQRQKMGERRSNKGPFWRLARLLNRLAEEWARQLLSWSYQWRGWIVLYDRHYRFDFPPPEWPGESLDRFERWHRRLLHRFYPWPDLTIYLDAPAQVLFARKGEFDPAYLERRRRQFMALGRNVPGFVRVDATQHPDQVLRAVLERIREKLAEQSSPRGVARSELRTLEPHP